MKKALQPICVLVAAIIVGRVSVAENSRVATSKSIPKNIILVIGDGMGPQQIGLLELYAKLDRKTETAFRKLASKSTLALVQPIPAGGLVVDSGCAATTLASGVEALPETLGLDARGKSVESILERAKKAGKSVGLVSDTRITHATPAAFVAHSVNRDDETGIAYQIANSSADVLLSGGSEFFDALNPGKGETARAAALENGFTIVSNAKELFSAASKTGKLLGVFAKSSMKNAFDEATLSALPKGEAREPSLVEMTNAALTKLSQNPEGFFLMVESGQIDWAGHANDAGWLLHEMVRMDGVIEAVTKWQAANPATLLVVTADHETGGFSFSYAPVDVPPSYSLPEQPVDAPKYAAKYNFVPRGALRDLWLQSKPNGTGPEKCDSPIKTGKKWNGIVWSTATHTSTPVPLFAIGPAKDRFGGLVTQIEVGQALLSLVLNK